MSQEHFVDFHFRRIPFYHAAEATEAIASVLGPTYLPDTTPFYSALWQAFRTLDFVTPSMDAPGVLVWHVKS